MNGNIFVAKIYLISDSKFNGKILFKLMEILSITNTHLISDSKFDWKILSKQMKILLIQIHI